MVRALRTGEWRLFLTWPGPQPNEKGRHHAGPCVACPRFRSLLLALEDLENNQRALLADEFGRPVSAPLVADRQGVAVELVNAEEHPVFVVRDVELLGFLGGVQLISELLLFRSLDRGHLAAGGKDCLGILDPLL